ncbi:hypothetical protein PIB30_108904, partial [Stylosanthes scabra]|nr:hypothetical protein [Stylosanthes scabra]
SAAPLNLRTIQAAPNETTAKLILIHQRTTTNAVESLQFLSANKRLSERAAQRMLFSAEDFIQRRRHVKRWFPAHADA